MPNNNEGTQSPQGEISGAAREDLNYHTTAEDAGDNYFPQILKYTENAPQESILSRDNYSTSQPPSAISQPHGGRQKAPAPGPSGKGGAKVKKYFNKLP